MEKENILIIDEEHKNKVAKKVFIVLGLIIILIGILFPIIYIKVNKLYDYKLYKNGTDLTYKYVNKKSDESENDYIYSYLNEEDKKYFSKNEEADEYYMIDIKNVYKSNNINYEHILLDFTIEFNYESFDSSIKFKEVPTVSIYLLSKYNGKEGIEISDASKYTYEYKLEKSEMDQVLYDIDNDVIVNLNGELIDENNKKYEISIKNISFKFFVGE